MAITNAAFAVLANGASVDGPTPYTILSGDVSGGISIPASFFTTVLPYGQTGFVLERLTLAFVTSAPGTALVVVVKASQPTTDVPNEASAFSLANAGDYSKNINTAKTYYISGLTSARFMQADGSLLLNFTGTVGTTTMYGLMAPYAPAGPRG